MPFRKNLFGDSIAQPETTFSDIEQMIANRQFFDNLELSSADLFLPEDESFKFGGTLYFIVETNEGEDDNGDEQIDYNDLSVEFDNFETIEAAREWLENLTDDFIVVTEVA